jgi:two-component system NtrC family sensor kinase
VSSSDKVRAPVLIASWVPLSRLATAELTAFGWESVSGLLFAAAVSPAVVTCPWPTIVFSASLVLSAILAPAVLRSGRMWIVDVTRAVCWALAMLPVVTVTGPRALLGAGAFGLMASGVRRALYRHARDGEGDGTRAALRRTLDVRLAESTFVVGVVAGHILMLFLVAFLGTTNDQIRNAWWQVLPWLTLGGTLLFTLAVPRATFAVREALAAGSRGQPALLGRGLGRALHLPGQLALVNFGLWLACTTIGAFGFRTLFGWTPTDAAIVLALGVLFAWGISFYQRSWHLSILAPAVDELRKFGAVAPFDGHEGSLRRRMLLDFGLPLVFSCALSLFSSLGLYRTLVGALGSNTKVVLAVVGSFVLLVVIAGGVIAGAARELSRPMSALAEAADRVGRGDLTAVVPFVAGPNEVTHLGQSIERMRRTLGDTIAELEAERAGLEEKVAARTTALSRALSELKEAEAALLHREKMASLGQLVAGVAHEINNPLNAIAGSAQSLDERIEETLRVLAAYRDAGADLSPAKKRELERVCNEIDLEATVEDLRGISKVIHRGTDRAVRIVRQLLHFSRTTTDGAPSDVHAGLDEALSLLGTHLRHANIAIEKQYGELPEVFVRADEVNQIFLNVLTNALSALMGRSDAAIRVMTRVAAGIVEIAIEDNGPGVPVPLRTRIFDPFFTTKPAGQGTGLGLSISAQIAARHGGTLTVEDAPGGGARFLLRLPTTRSAPLVPQPLHL